MNGRKILITGGHGFLGMNLQGPLGNQGFSVLSLGKASENDICCDLSLEIPELPLVDVIFHAAGKAHTVPGSKQEKELFFKVNYEGTKKFCYALERLPSFPKAFIFISSVAVYGRAEGQFLREETPLNGQTPYAESKILAEEYLNSWCLKHHITFGILRLPLIVGPNPPGNLGAMINGIHTGKYFRIGQANAQKSMVLAEDIASILPNLAEVGGTYHLTDGYHPTFRELEDIISKVFNKKAPRRIPLWLAKTFGRLGDFMGPNFIINSDKVSKITADLTFDDSLAREKLGWKPRKVLDVLPFYLK